MKQSPKDWNPIQFFDPPDKGHTLDTEGEFESVPSFCDPTLPPELTGTGTPLTPTYCEPPRSTLSSIPARTLVPPFGNTGIMQSPPKAGSHKQQSPRPYNVAMELMAQLPLRMVDNALYAYDGQVFRFVSTSVMNRLIMAHCRQYVQAVGDASVIERIYKVVQAEPGITCRLPRQALPLVAMEDGLLDLNAFLLHQFSPDYFVTARLNGNFTRGGGTKCPLFDSFLQRITGGDALLLERIWQVIGYSIVPDTSGKCFFLLQGVSDSGKSLLGSIIEALIDEDLVTSLDLAAMGERFGPVELVGKLLCTALDLPSGAIDPRSVSLVKVLTGGDTVTVDVKYQSRIKFRCQATLILATNHPFLTRDNDPAFMQRAVVVPFRYAIPRDQQDRNLRESILSNERDAIIFRALQAYQRLRSASYCFAGNYQVNEIFSSQSGPVADMTSILWNFLRTYCIPCEGSFVPTAQLCDYFQSITGVSWPGGINQFSSEAMQIFDQIWPEAICRDRKHVKGRRNSVWGFVGITLTAT